MGYSNALTINGIGVLIAQHYTLRAYCYARDCGHNAELDLDALGKRLGLDHSTMHNALVPKLRCSKCGGKDLGLRLSPPTGAPGSPSRGAPIILENEESTTVVENGGT